ncbi:MAG: ABC transporter ATP-binding protein [Hydrotalea sp.]|nr:ABC transporter ATP-binding protein [Hydrotalea sp.]
MSKKVTKKSAASSRAINGPVLEFRNVDFAYGATHGRAPQEKILDSLSFAVPMRGLMSLLGPSGAGKTTILRLALGLEKPDNGEVFINRQLVSNNQFVVPPEKRRVGLLFQDIALFPHLTVFDNIAFGLNNIGLNNIGLNNGNGNGAAKNSNLAPLDKKNIVMRWLEQIGLPDFGNRYPHQLSGGEQQRVALARALAPGSRLILMDEPFSSLNERTRDDMRNWVLNFLAARGIAALMVTHSVEEAMFMSDSIAVLYNKKLQQHGTPADIYYNPSNKFVATMFGAVNQFYAEVQQGQVTTPLGQFTANHQGKKFHDGQMVEVIIRADAVDVQPENKNLTKTTNEKITGTITDVRFLGQHSLVTWRIDATTATKIYSRITTDQGGATALASGQRVQATVDKKGVFVFAKQ